MAAAESAAESESVAAESVAAVAARVRSSAPPPLRSLRPLRSSAPPLLRPPASPLLRARPSSAQLAGRETRRAMDSVKLVFLLALYCFLSQVSVSLTR